MKKKFFRRFIPHALISTIENYKILSARYGQYRSMRKWDCIDKENNPLPWYSYPAIEFIKQLDFSSKTVFEFGSGNSTIFWAQRCDRVISIEDNEEWYEKIKNKLPNNVECLLLKDKEQYTRKINSYPHKFDIVIIDGNHRYECALEALKMVKSDGIIILDNSDWFERTSELLRNSDLIEVDMNGFGPINGYTWTTSFYFLREVKLKPAQDRQPVHGIGSLHHRQDIKK